MSFLINITSYISFFIKERFQYKVNQSIRNSKYYLFEFKLSVSSLSG